MPENCTNQYVAIGLTSTALLISVCLNVVFCLLRRKKKKYAVNENMLEYGDEPLRQDSLQSYRFEDDEVERQENPIYGNICLDGGGHFEMSPEVCYEQMSHASTAKQGLKVQQGDVSYASLDLTANKKRRKKRKYHKQAQTHQAQTHPQPASQQNGMDQDDEADVTLPSRSSSLMVSRHSIYLNSHQVALEAEERERDRERERERERVREKEMERERDDNAEIEFEMHRNVHEDFDHSLSRSRQSLEQDS
ncbi:splicing regulatory glutamine/lysine-rich protein 1-like [Sinocyclocheilus rhinocerous]|uniref:splicing regulatory glutamine/lysine-rich protein 1-like n=1 Tax=Sinocyclocheilus rhinocerous TaxID=307959 RepID=UPI0007B885B9|nr:PREDICTED: splicing regulatory glutamine/lysine-rich protein 1-like [Sinocyclocheilus rhinocerous]